MEFDEKTEGIQNGTQPDNGNVGGSEGAENELGDFTTPLDKIRGNATGSFAFDAGDSDGGESGESQSDDDDENGEDFSTALEPEAEMKLTELFKRKGKHPFLNDQIIEDFCRNLRTCIFQELAAIEAGIAVNSMKEWLRQGRIVHEYLWDAIGTYDIGTKYGNEKLKEIVSKLTEADWVVFKFYTEATKAKAWGERDDLDFIARARSKDWRAAAYRLKIRNPEVYAETKQAPTTIVNTGDVTQSLTVVDFGKWMEDDQGESLEIEATDVEVIDSSDERTTE